MSSNPAAKHDQFSAGEWGWLQTTPALHWAQGVFDPCLCRGNEMLSCCKAEADFRPDNNLPSLQIVSTTAGISLKAAAAS